MRWKLALFVGMAASGATLRISSLPDLIGQFWAPLLAGLVVPWIWRTSSFLVHAAVMIAAHLAALGVDVGLYTVRFGLADQQSILASLTLLSFRVLFSLLILTLSHVFVRSLARAA